MKFVVHTETASEFVTVEHTRFRAAGYLALETLGMYGQNLLYVLAVVRLMIEAPVKLESDGTPTAPRTRDSTSSSYSACKKDNTCYQCKPDPISSTISLLQPRSCSEGNSPPHASVHSSRASVQEQESSPFKTILYAALRRKLARCLRQ